MKYELLLSFQSALDSNQVKSKCPNRTASMCDLDRNKAMETRSSDSKVKLIRLDFLRCRHEKKVVRNSKALEIKNTKSVAPNDKIFAMAAQMVLETFIFIWKIDKNSSVSLILEKEILPNCAESYFGWILAGHAACRQNF
ncbi:hypothetical protein TNCV_968581 [Trichonephila clavipes]|nr:hypothetical protein TNCV_968581 [Trichonephila clavipes]